MPIRNFEFCSSQHRCCWINFCFYHGVPKQMIPQNDPHLIHSLEGCSPQVFTLYRRVLRVQIRNFEFCSCRHRCCWINFCFYHGMPKQMIPQNDPHLIHSLEGCSPQVFTLYRRVLRVPTRILACITFSLRRRYSSVDRPQHSQECSYSVLKANLRCSKRCSLFVPWNPSGAKGQRFNSRRRYFLYRRYIYVGNTPLHIFS